MTKLQRQLFNKAVYDIRKFCVVNGFNMPKIIIEPNTGYNKYRGWYIWDSSEIHIVPHMCVRASTMAGYSWHYPRYFTDMTVYGVLCHEFAHYVHCKQQIGIKYPRFKHERSISTYELNNIEKIAEAIRLFISNPDLLRRANPKRYAFVTDVVKLKPAVTTHWKRRLGKQIHPKFITQCNKRINTTTNRV